MVAFVLYYGMLVFITASAVHATKGDARNCGTNYRILVHPGGGFDNLQNEDMDLVHKISYSKCQTTPDGKYLLPDNAFAIPLHQSSSMHNSEIFEHWDNYTDLTAASINADTSFTAINGKFSKGYMEMKQNQIKEVAKSTRAQVKHTFYTIKLKTAAELDLNFKCAVNNIGYHVEKNHTEYAAYLAQLLIRDYGTHYTTSVDAGAVLAKTDHLGSSLFKNSQNSFHISAEAGILLFGNTTSLGAQINESKLRQYKEKIKHTQTVAHGGLLISTTHLSIADWERSVPNALVTVDRTGRPLHYAINTLTLPDMLYTTVPKVSELVKNATIQYYNLNTLRGCIDPTSLHFNYRANLEDEDACNTNSGDYNFGGIYQTCKPVVIGNEQHCNSVQQKNGLTGGYTCPPQYKPIELYAGRFTRPVLHTNGLFQYYELNYHTYWCAWTTKSEPPDEGYMFGGFYTPKLDNFLTGKKTCPEFFTSVSMLSDVKLCLSRNYEQGQEYAVNFSGFFSCSTGNPFGCKSSTEDNEWPHKCPTGTIQHRMVVKDNCQISYCSAPRKSKLLNPIQRPPFNKQPDYPSSTNATRLTEDFCSREETECS